MEKQIIEAESFYMPLKKRISFLEEWQRDFLIQKTISITNNGNEF